MEKVIGGRYRLVQSLGAGGMGQVWRAEDQVLHRSVAVKSVTLTAHLDEAARDEMRTRVIREARAAARIDHPSSVRVFDVRHDGDEIHVVMELVAAPNLAQVVAEHGPLDPVAAAGIGLGLLGVLEAAHGAGIVHRDVKPANVMVLDGGGVKLGDFGIAAARDDTKITAVGSVLGTPSYMAPEQARGEPAKAAADLWGLGALLYFTVEGAAPFDRGAALPTLNAVLHDPPRPAPSGPLGPAIEALLTKSAEQRATIAETRAALAAIARQPFSQTPPAQPATVSAGAPAPPPPPPPQTPATPSAALRRTGRGWLIGTGVATVLTLLALVAVANLGLGEGPTSDTPIGQAVPSPSDPVPTDPPTTVADPQAAPVSEPAITSPNGVPADWVRYRDEGGIFTIWRPPAWGPQAGPAGAVDFVDANSGDYLRVDSVEDPGDDPVAAWETASARFDDRYDDYEELGIDATSYRGNDAAVWEYTYEGRHATNLGIVTPGRGFALNFQTAEERWADRQAIRQAFETSFAPL